MLSDERIERISELISHSLNEDAQSQKVHFITTFVKFCLLYGRVGD